MKNSICLILPFFGKFPNYFQLFLRSCKNNPSIDWLIFTDDHTKYMYPLNVSVNYCSFRSFVERIQNSFDYKISLEKPYKLCDFKPAYGDIFYEEIRNYDFWGYCDCDLIFGNIRKFLPDKVLARYDKFFSRGHLTIFRNNTENNTFYKNQRNVDPKEVYTDAKAFAFDEWGG